MKDTFTDLLKSSVIMQGVLSLAVVGAWIYLLVAGLPVPDGLNNIVGLVIGFFFGSKLALQAAIKKGD